MRSADAKKAILDDIEAACVLLEPFADRTIKEFAEFLARADHYDRTGVLLAAPAKPRASAPRAAKAPKPSVEEALDLIRALYDRALSDEITHDLIRSEVKKLEALTKPELERLALHFGLGKPKTKAAALEAIERKISDRRTSFQRTLSIQP